MRYGIVGMVLGASLLRAATGSACSEPRYAYSIDGMGPGDGAAVNAPLLVTFTRGSSMPGVDPETLSDFEPVLELNAVGSDEKLEVEARSFGWVAGLIAFVPKTPLSPNTTYDAKARLTANATEEQSAIWRLTTGTATRPPLSLEGDLKVSFEAGTEPVFECDDDFGSCGPHCVEVGEAPVTKARITLPTATGGFAEEYLSGSVSISSTVLTGDDGTLKTEDVPDLEAGKPGELLVTMPLVDDKPYVPCFTFEIIDARRDSVRNFPVCLDEAFPAPAKPDKETKPEPKPDPEDSTPEVDDTAGNNANDEGFSRETSSGCSVGGSRPGAASALVALLGLAALSRRRRSRSAL